MAGGVGVYGRLLADPAARRFCLAGLVARMQISMTGLSIVLMISILTGSFGRAGLVTGVATLTAAASTPWWGRLIDRIGQARVLVFTSLLYAVGTSLLIATVLLDLSLPLTLATAVLAGFGSPQAGVCVRARWAHRLTDRGQLDVAYALEAMVDEVIFITGPVLATFAATAVHPASGLVLCVVLTLVGGLVLAAQRDTEPPRTPAHQTRVAVPIGWRLLTPLVGCSVALGVIFGGMEVAIVAFATEAQMLKAAGLFTMAWAVGSLIAGFVTGTISWRAPPARRFRIGATALAVSVLPLALIGNPFLMAAVLLVSGLAIAPTLIASVAVVQSGVPAMRLAESLGWTQMGLAGGVALGGAGIGRLIDGWQSTGGFWGIAAAGVALALGSLTVRAPTADPDWGEQRVVTR